MIKEIAFTAYRVTDMARARAFYEGTLGLSPGNVYGNKWVEYGIGGGCFAIQTVTEDEPSGQRGLIAFEVDDLDRTVADLRAAGVAFMTDAIVESPVCHMALVKDPDDNPVCLHRLKSPAAP